MSSDIGEDVSLNSDSEDELDWEEVEVPQQERHLEITLDAPSKSKTDPTKCVYNMGMLHLSDFHQKENHLSRRAPHTD